MLVAGMCNQKGGVGKTTTTVNLARAAYKRGMRTLIVDLDSQANTTRTVLGDAPATDVETLADVLSVRSDARAKDVILPTGWSGVDCLPSGGDALAEVGGELVGMGPGREHRLSEALEEIAGDYELTLIDCPPSLDQLAINGLTAAHRLVIVTAASQFSLDGIARLLRTIETVRRYLNSDLGVAGIIANAVETQTRRQKHWLEELKNAAPAPIWEPPIPKATWIGEALEAGLGLDEWGTPSANVIAGFYDDYLTNLLQSGGVGQR
jgi:chromosome partitioning protein